MKEHPIYKGYYLTENGEVYSTRSGVLKKLSICYDRRGYPRLSVNLDNGKRKSVRIHRLVAETYIENSDNFPQVNHIDENKTNNQVSNLEWCTNKKNCQHSKCKYKWKILNIKTKEVYETNSLNNFCVKMEISCIGLHSTLPTSKKIKPHYQNYKIIDRILI